nr:uncharacterized protein LOC129460041 [Symphalangus syndactylus]XP_055093563.1 uncharacterized protein LOC129460041 [Symphalangus syndactylus]XP_055093564.1 uncharacterized protein LOC129460041 [Symphalangus syndactylus]
MTDTQTGMAVNTYVRKTDARRTLPGKPRRIHETLLDLAAAPTVPVLICPLCSRLEVSGPGNGTSFRAEIEDNNYSDPRAWAINSLGSRPTFHTDKWQLMNKEAQEERKGSGKVTFPECPHKAWNTTCLSSFTNSHLRNTVTLRLRERNEHFGRGWGLGVLTAEPFHAPSEQRTAGTQGQVQSLKFFSKAARRNLEGLITHYISRM